MLFFFLIIILFLIFKKTIIKKNFLPDNTHFSKHKNFVTSDFRIPISAGFFLMIFIFIFKNDLGYLNLFYFFAIFLIGILSDRVKNFSPIARLTLQIAFSVLLILNTQTIIQDVRIDNLNIFLQKNIIISATFTVFCFLVLMNGTNFIDGVNLNTIGYYIIVYLFITLISKNNNLNLDYNFTQKILIFLFTIYFLNYLNKTQLGDSGAYLLSFFTAYYVIEFINLNPSVSPYFAVLILWYPCFENLFSIFRKIYQKQSVSVPDNLHLHHKVFIFLKDSKFKRANNISGFILNLLNLFLLILSLIYFDSTIVLITMVMINIFFYVLLYYFLSKKLFKKS